MLLDVDIVILPKEHNHKKSNEKKTNNNNDNNNNDKDNFIPKGVGKSVEGQEGLKFIANWIEVIILRLKVNVQNLSVYISDNDNNNSICVTIPNIEYYNTHPSSVPTSVSSSSLSSSIIKNGKT